MKNTTNKNINNNSYKIRGNDIPSRFFFAPINTGYTDKGQPTIELIRFHEERSDPTTGINYVGNVAIGKEFIVNNKTLYFDDTNNTNWVKLALAIDNNGSLPGVQIGCMYSKIPFQKCWINKNVSDYLCAIRKEILSLSETDITNIINRFINCANKLYNSGYKAIQIHAAHGYLLSCFLSDSINKRNDKFGQNKILILESIVNGIRKESPNLIIDVRISLLEGIISKAKELNYKSELIDRIVDLDVDIISFSNGIYNIDKRLIYPPYDWGKGAYIKYAIPYANKYKRLIWNTCGNIWDLENLDFPNNLTLSIGRSLIADPKFIKKNLFGQKDSIIKCMRCDSCHYYSNGASYLRCNVQQSN